MQTQVSTAVGPIFVLVLTVAILLVVAIFTVLMLVAYCKITAKMGYHWALGILMIVPFGNIILPLYLAFADWPIERELRQLRQQSGGTPG
jgi:hypothetical protein